MKFNFFNNAPKKKNINEEQNKTKDTSKVLSDEGVNKLFEKNRNIDLKKLLK